MSRVLINPRACIFGPQAAKSLQVIGPPFIYEGLKIHSYEKGSILKDLKREKRNVRAALDRLRAAEQLGDQAKIDRARARYQLARDELDLHERRQ